MSGSLTNLVVLASVSPAYRPCLTLLERRVLRLVALGHNRREIAVLLDQTVDVVEKCQAKLKRKADVTTLRELAHWAWDHHIVPPDDRLSQLERAQMAAVEPTNE